MHILAGDIGGTNTRLIFAEVAEGEQRVVAEKSYLSSQYSGLIELINIFLSEYAITKKIDAACFAVAGPVEYGIASITNLPWVIREQQLVETLKTPGVKLINDFAAAAHGISTLHDNDTLTLQQGTKINKKLPNRDVVVIGAGTGFGVAHIIKRNNHDHIHSSEAGHVGFAPGNALQSQLLSWLQINHSHVSLEMLLSGKGLLTIYHFLHEVTGMHESFKTHEAMQKNDPAQVISENALLESDALCQKTLDMFIDIYGAAASNVALHYYPVDELYIAGGIAPKIKTRMMEPRFIDAFLNKGVMTSNMKKITIKLIVQDKVGLYGALLNARDLL